MDLSYNKMFGISVTALNINQSNPFLTKNKKWLLKALLLHGFYTYGIIVIVYNIFYCDITSNNFTQLCKNGIMVVMYLEISYAYLFMLNNSDRIISYVAKVNRDFELAKGLCKEEQDIVIEYAGKGRSVCRQWLAITAFGTFAFLGKNFVLYVYYYLKDDFRLVPFYDLTYSTFIEERKYSNILVYLFTYCVVFYFDLYTSTMYVGFVPLGPVLLLHAGGQLEIVRRRIEQMYYIHDDQVMWQHVQDILQRLQYITSFVDGINESFQFNYEITLKLTALILPFGVFEILETMNQGEFAIDFVSFVIGGLMISSTPCYYSDMLMDKGEQIRLAIYSCGWERYYDRRMRSTIHMMLMQALRPFAINTVFKTMSLETLADVYQQAYTIFNLMCAMWNK